MKNVSNLLKSIAELPDAEFAAMMEGMRNLASARSAQKAATFVPGQIVEFDAGKRGTVRGKVVKIGSKNVKVEELYRNSLFGKKDDKAMAGLRWNVYPGFLKVIEGARA